MITLQLTSSAFVFAQKGIERAYIPYDRMTNFEIKPYSFVSSSVVVAIQGYKNVPHFTYLGSTDQLENVYFRLFGGYPTSVRPDHIACEQLVRIMEANGIFDKFKKSNPTLESSPDDILGQIEKLGELYKNGVLTDVEFESKKAELLKRL